VTCDINSGTRDATPAELEYIVIFHCLLKSTLCFELLRGLRRKTKPADLAETAGPCSRSNLIHGPALGIHHWTGTCNMKHIAHILYNTASKQPCHSDELVKIFSEMVLSCDGVSAYLFKITKQARLLTWLIGSQDKQLCRLSRTSGQQPL
jgi:hypothetical protein